MGRREAAVTRPAECLLDGRQAGTFCLTEPTSESCRESVCRSAPYSFTDKAISRINTGDTEYV